MNRLKSIWKQKKPYLFFLLAAVLLMPLYYLFVFSGQLNQLRQLDSLLHENRETLRKAPDLQQEVMRLKAGLETSREEVKYISSIMPPYRDVPGLIVGFWNLIEKHNLESKQLSMGSEVEESLYSYYTVHFSVQGKPEDVYAFLEDLEQYPRKLGFAELLLISGEEDLFRAELMLEVYMLGLREDELYSSHPFDGLYGHDRPLEISSLLE